MRRCTDCGLDKDEGEYHKKGKYLQSYCKSCGTGRSRNQYQAMTEQQKIARGRSQRTKHRERIREYMAGWQRRNPELRRDNEARRRAKRYDANAVPIDRSVIFLRDDGICGLCGLFADPLRWEIDHIQPLARGGEHTPENVQVSHPRCNRSKGARRWPKSPATRGVIGLTTLALSN